MSELEKVDPRILGGRIAEFRKACGKTQGETGKHLGMSRPTYIAIEKGTRRATPDEIVKFAWGLMSNHDHLFLRTRGAELVCGNARSECGLRQFVQSSVSTLLFQGRFKTPGLASHGSGNRSCGAGSSRRRL